MVGGLLAACAAPPAPPTSAPGVAPSTGSAAAPTSGPAAVKETAGAPASKPAGGDRLVIAVGLWGAEMPLGWKATIADEALWSPVFDPLIMRDPQTFAHRPGLATEWGPSTDYKSWTFKLRQGVMFHENYGEVTSEDVKFVIEQNLAADANGIDAPFYRSSLDRVETPDKYTVIVHLKTPTWTMPQYAAQTTGMLRVMPKKYIDTVGVEKAMQHPIGSGPYRHVDGQASVSHRFEAVPNHWRVTPAYKELVIRRVPEQATRVSALRSGEVDVASVNGDFLDQAKAAGFRIHEAKNVSQIWVVLPGQTSSDRADYCPDCAWVGDPNDAQSRERAKKVRQALNLAVDRSAIIDAVFRGYADATTPWTYYYSSYHKGYNDQWKIPGYDLPRAKQLMAEAGYPNGFEIRLNPLWLLPQGPDLVEALALDWAKIGVTVKRVPEDFATFISKARARQTEKTGYTYSAPVYDEPSIGWVRNIITTGVIQGVAEGPYDSAVAAIIGELDIEKRAQLSRALGQRLYEEEPAVPLLVRSLTWAVNNKVSTWPTLPSLAESNYEYIVPPAR